MTLYRRIQKVKEASPNTHSSEVGSRPSPHTPLLLEQLLLGAIPTNHLQGTSKPVHTKQLAQLQSHLAWILSSQPLLPLRQPRVHPAQPPSSPQMQVLNLGLTTPLIEQSLAGAIPELRQREMGPHSFKYLRAIQGPPALGVQEKQNLHRLACRQLKVQQESQIFNSYFKKLEAI